MLQVLISPQHAPFLFYLLTMMTHDTGLRNFLGNIRSPEVVYNAEGKYYFTEGGMGSTTLVQTNM